MGQWIDVLDVTELPPGAVRRVQAGERRLAICNEQGRVYAVDHACPHAGGPLGRGTLTDGRLVCPVHHWAFDLKTGLSDPNLPAVHLTFYACRVEGDRILVDPSRPIPPEDIIDPGRAE
jgi:nitrite reductase/ring-hydroxylating ferredoxin subunit